MKPILGDHTPAQQEVAQDRWSLITGCIIINVYVCICYIGKQASIIPRTCIYVYRSP